MALERAGLRALGVDQRVDHPPLEIDERVVFERRCHRASIRVLPMTAGTRKSTGVEHP